MAYRRKAVEVLITRCDEYVFVYSIEEWWVIMQARKPNIEWCEFCTAWEKIKDPNVKTQMTVH